MKSKFRKEVQAGFKSEKSILPEKLTEGDLLHLPDAVKKYLHLVGAVGSEKVRNIKLTLEGKIRTKPNDEWMNLTAVQYSFFDNPLRIFYLRASKMKIPVLGLHIYKNTKAGMVVKLAGLIKIVDVNGAEINMAETVTHFNDMCLLAPATLINKSIKWNEINPYKVDAEYTNGGNTVSATLYFNNRGELFNFISTDRWDLSNAKAPMKYPFSTPVSEYKNYGDFYLAGRAKTINHKFQGDFCYGEFSIKSIVYNCKE